MTLFASLWQAGYEGADHINRHGDRLSMNLATDHLRRAQDDYAALAALGIRTVRESAGWRLIEHDGQFDFSSLESRLQAAHEHNIQISWTFCHYGWPDDVEILSAQFVPRFTRYCRALAAWLAPYYSQPPIYSPINEISFTSWGLSVHLFRRAALDEGVDAGKACKRQLVRAALAGCDAIWSVDKRARILHCDPVIHLVAPDDSPHWQPMVDGWNGAQYEAWDMLSGRLEPELGGAAHYLDLIGANYYHDNQWEAGSQRRLWWHLADARRKPLHEILVSLQQRYQRPMILAETSHVGSGRGAWIKDISAAVGQAMLAGVDVQGICLYPIIDRPDWENANAWHHSGLWDLDREGPDPMARQLCQPYARALRTAQRSLHRFSSMSATNNSPKGQDTSMTTIVVFCHLRWDFVYQRPQHLLTRLAQYYPIIFIEEPVFDEGLARLALSSPAPNVTVCRPHTPSRAAGFHDDQITWLLPLVADLLPADSAPIVWFYTPMALPLLAPLNPGLVVYDCMDELAAFKHAPRQLLQRESALLTRADLLFTGGPSLYEAKRHRHNNGHCFPSSVDATHFEQALDRSNSHPLQTDLPSPRLGYYGVIDERLDLALLAAMADAHPEWQLVMVGPVVKIDPASLPQRPNIHYFGQQAYQALPQFLAGWDVSLLPFALNDSTRFISPTKVLEYMAAQLPVVSTAITDVVTPYSPMVAIGNDHADFISACERMLALSSSERVTLAAAMQAKVADTSWDDTAGRMAHLLEQALTALQQQGTLPIATALAGSNARNSASVQKRSLGNSGRVS